VVYGGGGGERGERTDSNASARGGQQGTVGETGRGLCAALGSYSSRAGQSEGAAGKLDCVEKGDSRAIKNGKRQMEGGRRGDFAVGREVQVGSQKQDLNGNREGKQKSEGILSLTPLETPK